MPEKTPIEPEPIPLRYVLTPPASLDEAVARASMVSGRMISHLWGTQRMLENCVVRVHGCAFGTAEQIWRQSLEACYLRAPRKAENIKVA